MKCRSARVLLVILFLTLTSIVFPQPSNASTGTNLIKNGDFSQPLEPYWKFIKLEKANPDYPRIGVNLTKGILVMDLPWNTSGYVYQEVDIPDASQVVLSLKVWGANVRTIAGIVVENSLGEHDVDWFLVQVLEGWGGTPYVRTYNLTEFAGQRIVLRIYGSGEWLGEPTGQFLYVDDVRIEAVAGRQSVIVRYIRPKDVGKVPGQTEVIELGYPVVLIGRLYPTHETTVRVEYKRPDGSLHVSTVSTDSLGKFQDTFIPDATGIWTATVYWDGDWDHDASSSQSICFAVCPKGGIYLDNLVVNGVPVSNLTFPEIQAKPNEMLSGEVDIVVWETFQCTAVLVIGLNSWEKDRYDIIGGQWVWPAEALDLKVSWFDPPYYRRVATHRDPMNGSFVVRMHYVFPLNMSYSPSYITPPNEGTYYLIVMGGAVNTAEQLTGPVTLLGRERHSIWIDVSGEEWERFLLGYRNETSGYGVFTVRLVVVDVDRAMTEADGTLAKAERYGIDIKEAKQLFSQGVQLCHDRSFLQARDIFVRAKNIADLEIDRRINDVNNGIRFYGESLRGLAQLIDFYGWTESISSAREKQQVDDFYNANILVGVAEILFCESVLTVAVIFAFWVLFIRWARKRSDFLALVMLYPVIPMVLLNLPLADLPKKLIQFQNMVYLVILVVVATVKRVEVLERLKGYFKKKNQKASN